MPLLVIFFYSPSLMRPCHSERKPSNDQKGYIKSNIYTSN